MSGIKSLLEEYPGDGAWQHFASLFQSRLANHPERTRYLASVEDEDMAEVVADIGDGLDWLERPVPALDGSRPAELKNHPHGRSIIRSLLMRMPR